LSKADYLAHRERLQREIDALRTEDEFGATLERAATLLADIPTLWASADQAQKNALARMLFAEIHVKDAWIVAVKPQPTFAPFFTLDCQARRLSGGSDGARTRGLCLDRAAC